MSTSLLAHAWTRTTLRVTGPDAKSWLNSLITCDLELVTETRSALGLFLGRTGKIQSDAWVVQAQSDLLIAVSATAAGLETELNRMLIMEDAELVNQTGEHHWFSLDGLGAAELGAQLARAHGGLSTAIAIAEQDSCLLSIPDEHSQRVAEVLPLASEKDWSWRRMQLNWPLFGLDYTEAERPHEAALERRAVSWTKGCYLGQEVVCMQDMRGKVKRSLRRLRVRGQTRPELLVGEGILVDGRTIGRVTSAAASADGSECWCFADLQLASLGGTLSLADPKVEVTLVA